MSAVERIMLRGLIDEYVDSEDEHERMLGRTLLFHTCDLDGEAFHMVVSRLIHGLKRTVTQFERDWDTIRDR